MKDLRKMVSFINTMRQDLGSALRLLEQSGDINSDGDISVATAINEFRGYRTGYYLYDTSSIYGRYVTIGSTSGKIDKSLIITETGKLYL